MDLLAAKIVFINNFQELEYIENLYLKYCLILSNLILL